MKRRSLLKLLFSSLPVWFLTKAKAEPARIPGLPLLPRCLGPYCHKMAVIEGNLEHIERDYERAQRFFSDEFRKHGIKVTFLKRRDSNQFTPCNSQGNLVVFQTVADAKTFELYGEKS